MDDYGEDMVKDARDIFQSKHLGKDVDEEDVDNLPSAVTRGEILEERRYDGLRKIVMANGTTGKSPVFFKDTDGDGVQPNTKVNPASPISSCRKSAGDPTAVVIVQE